MRAPWANVLLLILLALQLLSGYLALTNGAASGRWTVWLHGAGAYAVLLLLIWKGQVIVDALRRKRVWTTTRYAFFFLLFLLVLTMLSGIVWTIWGPIHLGGFSLISLHIYVAVPLLVLMAWHAWRQRFVLRLPAARDRRLFLRGLALAVGGALAWTAVSRVRAAGVLGSRQRRFTGSFETGSYDGRFPTVSWIADRAPAVDPGSYRLQIDGAVAAGRFFSYAELADLAEAEKLAVLDCTGGWYSEQLWRGVRVGRLLTSAGLQGNAASVTFESLTGYRRRFPLDEAQDFLLALEVAGERLTPGHGFPVRLVAAGYRGYDWVKWLARITVQTSPAGLQAPLPLQ